MYMSRTSLPRMIRSLQSITIHFSSHFSLMAMNCRADDTSEVKPDGCTLTIETAEYKTHFTLGSDDPGTFLLRTPDKRGMCPHVMYLDLLDLRIQLFHTYSCVDSI